MVVNVAKPISYVVELNREEAQAFLEDILTPRQNPARDATIDRAKRMRVDLR